MSDYDITSKHHGGDPLSTAAHANTLGQRTRGIDRVARYIDSRPNGANFAEAETDLELVRNTVTARFSDVKVRQLAFPVKLLHQYGLFTGVEAERPVPLRRTPAQVLMGRQRTESACDPATFSLIRAATYKPSRAKGSKAPIEQMSDTLWMVYRHIDKCGDQGTTADAAQLRLALDQGNCSNRFRDLRKVKAVIPVKALHEHGAFLNTRATRPTRNRQAAAVLVSFETVGRSDISKEAFNLLFSDEEVERLERFFLDPDA